MPSRSKLFTQLPWRGGMNSSVDPGVLSPDDLVRAENVQFSTSGARIKKEDFTIFDAANSSGVSARVVPRPLGRSSSGTTRTLVLGPFIQSALDHRLVVGEKIRVTDGGNLDYQGYFTVASITTVTPAALSFVDADVNVTTDVITKVGHGFYDAMPAVLSTSGVLPGGLTAGTVYYVITQTADTYKLATTFSNALNSTAVDITSAAGGGTHTTTPQVVLNNAITYVATTSLSEAFISTLDSMDIERNHMYVGLCEYWRDSGGVREQLIIAVSNEPKIYRYDNVGRRLEISAGVSATALSDVTTVNFVVAGETLLMGFNGLANTPKKYNPDVAATWEDLGGSPPNFEFMQIHLGRVFANDKSDRDRLHYSSPFDFEEWGGVGDSGAIDITPGDGDPRGIISIARPFRGRMFVSKKRKIVDLQGDAPETFYPVVITEGLGMVSHQAIVPIDVDDLMFLSDRGFHSMAATDTQGDFASSFLSQKIQNTFNEFNPVNIETTKGVYLPEINSVAFSASSALDTTGLDEEQLPLWAGPSDFYLFNVIEKEWYRWTTAYPRGVATRLIDERERALIFGTPQGTIAQLGSATASNLSYIGSPSYVLQSGAIYPSGNLAEVCMFKRFFLYFKPLGNFDITLTYSIDNQAEASITIPQPGAAGLLGSTFVLGETTLGSTSVLAPIAVPIDGIGRGITIRIESAGQNQPMEIYGYSIEYEPTDLNQEVIYDV